MRGRTIVSVDESGRRVARPALRREPRFYAGREIDDHDDRRDVFAIVDSEAEAVLAYATEQIAPGLAALLNALATGDGLPTADQVEGILGNGPRAQLLLRTIQLRKSAPCRRCGRMIPAGTSARWNRASKLVQHLRRCPAEREKKRATKRRAA